MNFDNAGVDTPRVRDLRPPGARARATDDPPTLLVLNGCDTLDGAEVLLDSTPVIIAMATEITDLAASVFAARFYSAVASSQPVGPGCAARLRRIGPRWHGRGLDPERPRPRRP